uniref:Rho-GAP domain-containing protein n=1 Tax=Gongylonema pulchrum TaxID=637853 RepID=A0A183D726_9BILA
LSEVQLEKIDTLPLLQCRLVLASAGSSHSSMPSIVTHFKYLARLMFFFSCIFKKRMLHLAYQQQAPVVLLLNLEYSRRVLSRSESRRFFGRPLEGSSPPQPVLTMIDHLILHGVDVEGLFRKSPKQSTLRMLKAQLDRGSVPDFYQFNPHVTAALLKEYLREIPGKLLLSGNFELWALAMEQTVDRQKAVHRLLQMLPSAHSVLLSRFLRLLRAISSSPQSKMTAQSLAVCIAPSLLDNPKMDSATSWLPELAEYLIVNAPFLLEPFQDAQLAISSSVSNDSGLSDVDVCLEASVSTSDSGILGSPSSTSSQGISHSPQLLCSIWKH